MVAANRFKKQKIVHTPAADSSGRERIPKNTAASMNKEDSLLKILADNQRRRNPELFHRKASTEVDQQAASTEVPTSEAPREGMIETTNANNGSKNLALPGFSKELDNLKSYDVRIMSIVSSTKIRNRVQQATQALTSVSTEGAPQNPVVVVLTAREGTASKLITIVEITKRNLDDAKKSWYQYSCVEPKMVEIARKTSNARNSMDDCEDEDEGGVAFETMLSAVERKLMDKPKYRAVPVMTVFLSCSPIKALKVAHGYV